MMSGLDYGLVIPATSDPYRFLSYKPVGDITTILGNNRHGGSHLGDGLVLWGNPDSVGEVNIVGSALLTLKREEKSYVMGDVVITAAPNHRGKAVLMTGSQESSLDLKLTKALGYLMAHSAMAGEG